MAQAAVTQMPNGSQTAIVDPSSDVVSLRHFVVDEDRANLGSDVWKTIDKTSFIRAQREALEAFNMAKAIRLSEQSQQRKPGNPAMAVVGATSMVAGSSQAPSTRSQASDAQYAASSSARARRASQSQPMPIPRRDAPQPSTADESIAKSLTRSWQVDAMQTSLPENRGRLPQPAPSRPKPSTSIYASQTQPTPSNHENRSSFKTPASQNVSLSTMHSASTHPHNMSGHHSRSQSQSASYSHSRAPSQAQTAPQPQAPRVESRPVLKRDPATVDGSFTASTPPPSRPHTSKTSTSSASASTDINQQKRRNSNAIGTSSIPSTQSAHPSYSYSTSNYSYYHPYITPNGNTNTSSVTSAVSSSGTSQASVQAQQTQTAIPVVAPSMAESKKQISASSASSNEMQSGQMSNPVNAGSSSNSAPSSRPSSKQTSPQVSLSTLPSAGTSSASAQAAAAEKENQRSRSTSRRRESLVQSPGIAPAQVHSPVQVHAQVPAAIQAQPQPLSSPYESQAQLAQGPRDIFAPTRFSCKKCGNPVHSSSHAQPSLALTSPDPFSHPSASSLHLTCVNPSCGTTHCRGCLKAVKCRDTSDENDSWALVSTSPSKQNHSLKPTSTPCCGGPGCALWACCQDVRAIAIWEALRAFDAVFASEAGFAVGGTEAMDTQHLALGRQHREAYVKLLISKADKSMRKFEDAFVRTMKAVGSWLQPSSVSFEEDSDDDDEEEEEDGDESESEDEDDHDNSGDDESVEDESSERLERESQQKQVVSLFRSSYLLEVFHAFLSNNKPRDWIAHSETYLTILEMMRRLMDSNLAAVLTATPTFTSLAGGSVSAPASAVYTPFTTPGGSSATSATSSPSSSQQQPPMSLHELIKQLEKLRSPLMNLASRMQFSATVDKVNNLCDAISYLLLQQMVA